MRTECEHEPQGYFGDRPFCGACYGVAWDRGYQVAIEKMQPQIDTLRGALGTQQVVARTMAKRLIDELRKQGRYAESDALRAEIVSRKGSPVAEQGA